MMWILLMTAWATTAEQRMYAGDVAGALEAARAEVETSPEDVDAEERYIDLLLNLYLADKAVERAKARVQKSPADPDAHYLLGRALPEVGPAQAAYERALKLEPLHARSHMGMGAIYTALGDPQRAAGAYGRAVSVDPKLGEAWLGLSRAHIGMNHIEEALAVCHKAIVALPDHPDAYLTAAVIDPGAASALLEAASEKAGHDSRVHAALADRWLEEGKAKKALASAERSLEINPGEAVAMRVKLFAGEIAKKKLSQQGYRDLLEARQANEVGPHDALVKNNPRSTAALLARSRAFRGAGNDPAALQDLLAARKFSPDEPEVLGQLGLLLLDLKRPEDAVTPLDLARNGRPWDLSLAKAWARAASEAGQHDEARALYRDLVKKQPYDTDLSIGYADALLRAQKPEAAYQVILAAAERRMDDKLVVALMSSAALAGRFGEAAAIMQEIADKTGDPKAAEIARQLRAKARIGAR